MSTFLITGILVNCLMRLTLLLAFALLRMSFLCNLVTAMTVSLISRPKMGVQK